jgi:predicted Rossmann fold nucleotide-binding protein DprA/Smf involved in DNA uptake
MFGIDLFLKSAATGMKMAQKGVENMVKMLDFYAGLSQGQSKSTDKKQPTAEHSQKDSPVPSVTEPPSAPETYTPKIETTTGEESVSMPEEEVVTLPEEEGVALPEEEGVTLPEEELEKKPVTAIDEVHDFIKKHKQGVTTEDIMTATGFPRKKVQNIIYKLKNRGKIIASEKGIYVPKSRS